MIPGDGRPLRSGRYTNFSDTTARIAQRFMTPLRYPLADLLGLVPSVFYLSGPVHLSAMSARL